MSNASVNASKRSLRMGVFTTWRITLQAELKKRKSSGKEMETNSGDGEEDVCEA